EVGGEPSFAMCTRCGACTMACPNEEVTLVEMDKVIDGQIVKRNRIQYSPEKCTQCGDCVEVCPYNMLKLTDEKVPLKGFCILCDQCIPACPHEALSLK
ncbi:MAG TPA: 4Fe-4S binding protein, partial [Methanobacteriaceae archaeon]|nr:4Fe-4S binding protein [Methanobacteriaceae archaeon]